MNGGSKMRLRTGSKEQGKKGRIPINYSLAVPNDKNQIRGLLASCELPSLYVHRHLKSFMVAKAAEEVVGVIGVEAYGRLGLFRSLCVNEAYRGRGIAKRLNMEMLARAKSLKIETLYMFTLSAEKFASKLGFRKVDKKRIPKTIRSTWQFQRLKPYPFVCMMKKLSDA
jgi:amino-acid N-acetyltransferase